MLKSNLREFIHPKDRNKAKKYFETLLNYGSYKKYEGRLKTKTGIVKYIQATSTLITDENKQYSFDIIRDVTNEKNIQNSLQIWSDHLDTRVNLQTDEIKATIEISIITLAMLAEARDKDTSDHLHRIKDYSYLLTQSLCKYSKYYGNIESCQEYIENVSLASILHDIGKVEIPREIILKPGKLTNEEFERMKEHTTVASYVLSQANTKYKSKFNKDGYFALAEEIARHHHEKWDGTGYPDNLSDESIPLSARIVGLCDVYDALRNRRPYKEPWSHEETSNYIIERSGTQFDPEVVNAFIKVKDQFKVTYQLNFKEEFNFI